MPELFCFKIVMSIPSLTLHEIIVFIFLSFSLLCYMYVPRQLPNTRGSNWPCLCLFWPSKKASDKQIMRRRPVQDVYYRRSVMLPLVQRGSIPQDDKDKESKLRVLNLLYMYTCINQKFLHFLSKLENNCLIYFCVAGENIFLFLQYQVRTWLITCIICYRNNNHWSMCLYNINVWWVYCISNLIRNWTRRNESELTINKQSSARRGTRWKITWCTLCSNSII